MNDNTYRQIKFKKLLQIYEIRLVTEEKRLIQARIEYQQACEKKRDRMDNIHLVNEQKNSLYRYLIQNDVANSPEKLNRSHEHRFWLNYDLEMHEYYLAIEEEAVAETKEKYQLLRDRWMRVKRKIEKLTTMYKHQANKEWIRFDENEEESSYEDMVVKGSLSNG